MWILYRDGQKVGEFEPEQAMWAYLHQTHAASLAHLFAHEGYAATQPDGTVYTYKG